LVSQDGGRPPILDLFVVKLDHPRKVLGGLYYYAKVGYGRYSSFENMEVSIFGANDWKTPIHASKLVFIDLTSYMGCNMDQTPKAHLCVSSRRLSYQT